MISTAVTAQLSIAIPGAAFPIQGQWAVGSRVGSATYVGKTAKYSSNPVTFRVAKKSFQRKEETVFQNSDVLLYANQAGGQG